MSHENIDAFSGKSQQMGGIKEDFAQSDAFSGASPPEEFEVGTSLPDLPPFQGGGGSALYELDKDYIPNQHISIFQIFNPLLDRYIGTCISRYLYLVFFITGIVVITLLAILLICESLAYGWVAFGFGIIIIPTLSCIFSCSYFFVLRLVMEFCVSIFHIRDSVHDIARKFK